MLLRQGDARDETGDRRLACALAAVAGALNAAAFSAVGFFSANMTGNVSALSDHMALGQWRDGGFYFTIVAAFIAGATISTLLINAGHRRGMHGIFAINILIEAGLLVLVGALDLWLGAPWRVPVVILGLSFLMGLQNAVVTRISDARIRTTHISGMATDIGIELGLLIDIARGVPTTTDGVAVRSRLRLHVATVVSFLSGGVVGVLIYRTAGGYLLWMTGGVLALMACSAIAESKRPQGAMSANGSDRPNDL